jgi:hypothetical protein
LGPAFTAATALLLGLAAFFAGAGRFLAAGFFAAFFFAVAILRYPPRADRSSAKVQD